jgi:hypothetical protein
MSIKTTAYTLPAHWACALINGDESGMSEEESAALDRWIKDTRPGYCLGCSDEPEFRNHHDADGYELAGDCLTFTFEEIKK